MAPIIHLEGIRKSYFIGKNELEVLKGISLNILKILEKFLSLWN